jgi:hypothetical protein
MSFSFFLCIFPLTKKFEKGGVVTSVVTFTFSPPLVEERKKKVPSHHLPHSLHPCPQNSWEVLASLQGTLSNQIPTNFHMLQSFEAN